MLDRAWAIEIAVDTLNMLVANVNKGTATADTYSLIAKAAKKLEELS